MDNSLKTHLDLENDIPILHITGRLVATPSNVVINAYESIPKKRREKVIIDFGETEYVNSSGISILIQLVKESDRNKNKIIFCSLSAHLCRVFEAVGLSEIVPVYSNVKKALDESKE